ncbi:iron permease [Cristinia sonorae]|uniref:Iron permease n=1 Tax=Cristinia sonorae TaxID=1940300 RepID=A0A8K0UUY8_9AGAR|nr:iron permease [Cristinia sonorae]
MDSTTEVASSHQSQKSIAAVPTTKGASFWLSYAAILVATLLSALDLTGVSTALPTITADLDGAENFVWVGSAYALSSTAILPLSGGLANIFGRRPVMLACVTFFAIGSALAGAAQNMNMLIAARAIQGIGGGGILNLTEIIVADLVPLAERGLYQGIVGLVWAFASGIGPPVGGALAQKASWRWLFYLNLPLSGLAFILVAVFLKVRTPEGSIVEKLKRVDWYGNLIVIAGTTLAVTGLTFAGVRFPWDSVQVLAPLIIGLALIAAFIVYEAKVPQEPTIPWEVISARTALSGYISTFTHGLVSIAIVYYLPVYFQASLGAGPIRSGVDMFPTALVISPFAVLAGVSTQVFGKYRPANVVGWVLLTVGVGVLSLLKADSSTGQWVGYQIIAAAGQGMLYTAAVFPVLAPQPVEHTASALAFFAFVRSFAQTWGITLASTVLQNELKRKLPADFLSAFPDGLEIAYAAIPAIRSLQEPLRTEVRVAFADSMSIVWKTMIGISGLGLLSLLFLQEIKMVSHTDATYGLTEGPRSVQSELEKQEGNGAPVSEL